MCLLEDTILLLAAYGKLDSHLNQCSSVFHYSGIRASSGECYDSFAPLLLFTFARLSSIRLSVFYFTLKEDKSQG